MSTEPDPFRDVALLGAEQPTLEEFQQWVTAILVATRVKFGHRTSCIILLGAPISDTAHDRFYASFVGSCLSARGLLEWGARQIQEQIDSGDTSRRKPVANVTTTSQVYLVSGLTAGVGGGGSK